MGKEIDYGELFGVTLDDGGNEQGVAAPAAEETAQSEKEQGVAAPAVEEPAAEGIRTSDDGQDEDGGGEDRGQTRQERAAQAALRRQRERDEAIQKAKEDARKEAQSWLDDAVKALGLSDPYTKKPITTKAELDAYNERHRNEERDRLLKKTGMTPEAFEQFVDSLPEVREARQALEQAKLDAQAAKDEKFRQQVREELAQIQKMNPTIQDLNDILQMETAPAFKAYVAKGHSYLDAYRLANYDALMGAAAEKGKREQSQKEKGRSHMGRTTGHGAGAVAVPSEVMDEYRTFNPNATEAEIQAHWASLQRKN